VGTLVFMEATLKYQPDNFAVLTLAHYLGWGQCMVGSLTGAVSSQRVTGGVQRYPQRGRSSRIRVQSHKGA